MSAKRQHLVETASRLFAAHGFHGTGIDRIAEVAKVSKKTMYNHFRSKEELILAALKQTDGVFRNDFMRAVEQRAKTPYDRLLAIFDVAQDWFADENYYGCMFINVIGEYSEKDSAIREVCKEFKRSLTVYIESLASAAGVKDAAAVANSLSLIYEGAIVTAQVSGSPQSAQTAKATAKVVIDEALGNRG